MAEMKKRKENPGQLILGAHYQNSAAVDDHVLAHRDLALSGGLHDDPGQLIRGAHYQNSAAVHDHVLAHRDLALLQRVGEHGATHREYQIIIILYIK